MAAMAIPLNSVEVQGTWSADADDLALLLKGADLLNISSIDQVLFTRIPSAEFHIDFTGTGIAVFGLASISPRLSIRLDSNRDLFRPEPGTSVLYRSSRLPYRTHFLSVSHYGEEGDLLAVFGIEVTGTRAANASSTTRAALGTAGMASLAPIVQNATQSDSIQQSTLSSSSQSLLSSSKISTSSVTKSSSSAASSTSVLADPVPSTLDSVPNQQADNPSQPKTQIIAGSVLGATAGLSLLGILIFFLLKRLRKRPPPIPPRRFTPSPVSVLNHSLFDASPPQMMQRAPLQPSKPIDEYSWLAFGGMQQPSSQSSHNYTPESGSSGNYFTNQTPPSTDSPSSSSGHGHRSPSITHDPYLKRKSTRRLTVANPDPGATPPPLKVEAEELCIYEETASQGSNSVYNRTPPAAEPTFRHPFAIGPEDQTPIEISHLQFGSSGASTSQASPILWSL